MSRDAATSKIPITNLAHEYLDIFKHTLSTILSTDLAKLTYSQIIDGLPVRDVWNAYACRRSDIEKHLEPCPESIEVWNAFRTDFQHHILQFNSTAVQGYPNSTPGTKEFNVRLLEVIAVALHDIAALLYKIADGGVGTHDEKPPAPIILDCNGVPYPPKPTDFYHTEYRDWEQYPQGVADMVGYWAEFEFFSGVVVFGRGESDTECKDAFIHPGSSFRIFQLSDTQLQSFASLGIQTTEISAVYENPLPFPFKAERYARRVEEAESMSLHIYRDRYERKPKINTSGRIQHPRVRLEDEPVTLDLLDMLKANNGQLP